jgi:HSP20 family molecular chaperone IbpA
MKHQDIEEFEVEDTDFDEDETGEEENEEELEEDLTDSEEEFDDSDKEEENVQKIEVEENTDPINSQPAAATEDWFGKEGELAIDVYQTLEDIVIQSAIAGVKAEDLDIQIENDVVTIKGFRANPNETDEKEYFHEECFWGPFARQVFLPEEINPKNVEASMQEGIFTLRLPKIQQEQTKKVKIAKK